MEISSVQSGSFNCLKVEESASVHEEPVVVEQPKEIEIGFEERLVAEVRKYPNIWNTGSVEYRDVDSRRKAWQTIVADVGCTMEEAKRKWGCLRDTFVRIQTKIVQSGPRPVSWRFYSHMQFLSEHVMQKNILRNANAREASNLTLVASTSPTLVPVRPSYLSDKQTHHLEQDLANLGDVMCKDEVYSPQSDDNITDITTDPSQSWGEQSSKRMRPNFESDCPGAMRKMDNESEDPRSDVINAAVMSHYLARNQLDDLNEDLVFGLILCIREVYSHMVKKGPIHLSSLASWTHSFLLIILRSMYLRN